MIRLALALLISIPAMAAPVCHEVPEPVSFRAMVPNFDGSVTIFTPKVYVNGRYTSIYSGDEDAAGLCAIFNKEYVHHDQRVLQNVNGAYLNSDGTLRGTAYTKNRVYVLNSVICR